MFFKKFLNFSCCHPFNWAETSRTITVPSRADNPGRDHTLANLIQNQFNSYGIAGLYRNVSYLERAIAVS
tara:strand:- start:576 stop:785 length:210 start_codon:yes stop_codon:yes gene_type:complete